MLGSLGTVIMYICVIVVAGLIFIKIVHTPKDKRQPEHDSSDTNKSN